MAWEIPLFRPGGLKANASLAAKQFYCVKMHSVDNEIVICGVDGEFVLGILQDKPAAGVEAQVMMAGISKVLVGTTVATGQKWTVDSSGSIRPASLTATGADATKYVGGIVLEGAAAGEYATVTVGLHTGIIGF